MAISCRTSSSLALSACYELIEWGAALVSDEAAEAFLGTQGYVWDTQSDMAFALLGTIIALTVLGRLHDRQLARLPARRPVPLRDGMTGARQGE